MKRWMLLLGVVAMVVTGCADDARPVVDVVGSESGSGPSSGPGTGTPTGSPAVVEPPPQVVAAEVEPGRAVLVRPDGVDARPVGVDGLTPLAGDARLVTPSAMVTVTAAGQWGLGPPSEGRVVLAWLVEVAAPPPLAPRDGETLFGDADLPPRDASTSLWLDTGSERLPVTPPGGDDPILARCDELPCHGPEPGERLLIAAADADARPALVATVDGVDQRLDLRTGTVTSEVSRAGYERPTAVPVAAPAWPQQVLPIRTQAQLETEFGGGAGDLTRGGLEVGYGGHITEAFLAPFDRVEGWAPPGHAWLVVQVEDTFRQPTLTSWRAELDAAASWSVVHDAGVATLAHPPSPADVLAFLIPDDARSVTLVYRPTGTVGLPPDARYEFGAPQPLTAEIALP